MLKVKFNHRKLVAMLTVKSVLWTRRLGFFHLLQTNGQYHWIFDQVKQDAKHFCLIRKPTDILSVDEWDSVAHENGVLVTLDQEVSLTGLHSVEIVNPSNPLYQKYWLLGYNDKLRFDSKETLIGLLQGRSAIIWSDSKGPRAILLVESQNEQIVPSMEVEATYDDDPFTQGHLESYFLGEDAELESIMPYRSVRTIRIYDHEVREAEILLKGFDRDRNGKYAIAYLPHSTKIVHASHEEIEIGKGWWLFWHPRPSRNLD